MKPGFFIKTSLLLSLKYFLYIIFFKFYTLACYPQENLIPDPSFEKYKTCPQWTNISLYSEFWYMPTPGTSDLFCKCANGISPYLVGVPQNDMGFQETLDGNCYAGFFAFYGFNLSIVTEYREYIATRLTKPLIKDKNYCFQLSISNTENFIYSINELGVFFSKDSVYSNLSNALNATPQITFKTESYFDNRTDWVNLNANYVAEGGENFIVFGNFQRDDQIDTSRFPGFSLNFNQSKAAYYFVDDVSLIECEGPIETFNVFTPNSDGINDTFFIKNIDYLSDVNIYNCWGNLIFKMKGNGTWDGKIKGFEASSGVYFYEAKTNEGKILKGVFHLIR